MKDLLPPMEHEFDLKVIGEDTNQEFSGKFKYKRLNIKAKGDAIKLQARLDESLSIDDHLYTLYMMLSWLRYGLVLYPDWWEKSNYGMELFDVNVVTELYKECMDFEDKWKKELFKDEKKKK